MVYSAPLEEFGIVICICSTENGYDGFLYSADRATTGKMEYKDEKK